MQLGLLVQALHLSMQLTASSGAGSADAGSVGCSSGCWDRAELEDTPGAYLVKAAVYLRRPSSLQDGQLQLQLVAASDGSATAPEHCLVLGEDAAGSVHEQVGPAVGWRAWQRFVRERTGTAARQFPSRPDPSTVTNAN